MLQMAATGSLAADTRLVGINAALEPPPAAARLVMQGAVGDILRSRAVRAAVRGLGRAAPMIELLLSTTGSRLTPAQEEDYVSAFAQRNPRRSGVRDGRQLGPRPAPRVASRPSRRRPSSSRAATTHGYRRGCRARRQRRCRTRTTAAVAGAGHLVHEERPADVAALIAAAIAAAPPGSLQGRVSAARSASRAARAPNAPRGAAATPRPASARIRSPS